MLKSKNKGILIIISSPSGAGKTTIAKKLISESLNIELSVSLTTRTPRNGEIDGIDYKFVSKDLFKKKIKRKLFLEHAKVFGNFYGTLKSEVITKLNKGKNILLDIDWQGARQVRKKFNNFVLSIFILPPSLNELKTRLKRREKDLSFVNRRMSKAKKEIKHWNEYDYVVVNKNLNDCIKVIKNIILSESYRPFRQFVRNVK